MIYSSCKYIGFKVTVLSPTRKKKDGKITKFKMGQRMVHVPLKFLSEWSEFPTKK
jgi:hypothetical protein